MAIGAGRRANERASAAAVDQHTGINETRGFDYMGTVL